jgi:hypothetical protein
MLYSFELAEEYGIPSQAIVHMAAYIVGGQTDARYWEHAQAELDRYCEANDLLISLEKVLGLRAAAEELVASIEPKDFFDTGPVAGLFN